MELSQDVQVARLREQLREEQRKDEKLQKVRAPSVKDSTIHIDQEACT